MNPLLEEEFKIPFRSILPEHIEPGIREAVARAERELAELVEPDRPLTWDATVAAFDAIEARIDRVVKVAHHLNSVVSTPELRAAFQAALPVFSAFYADLGANTALFGKITAFAATAEAAALPPLRKRRLEHLLRDFRRLGIDLPPQERERVKAINMELAEVRNSFSEHVLDDTRDFELVITDEADLRGLPASSVRAAREAAQAKGRDGWLFTLHQPSIGPVLQYALNRDLRRQMFEAFTDRAAKGETANQPLIRRILQLRQEQAGLLGYADYADYRLEVLMVGSGQAAVDFEQELYRRTVPYWQQEIAELDGFARKLGLGTIEAWDLAFVTESMRREQLDFDAEQLRPYFSFERVMSGLFELARRLFGVTVTEVSEADTWHEDVRYYDMHDTDGTHLASFYTDWFPRAGKRAGAWFNSFITGGPTGDGGFDPHLGIIMGNLTPPVGDAPAQFTHREVQTVFHEFGHLLHHCLSRVSEPALASTRVPWDWVELPSQILENWTTEREALDLFARHVETGEPVPEDLLQKLRAAAHFAGAHAQMRQLSFSALDLALHREYDPHGETDPITFVNGVRERYSARPELVQDNFACAFTHIFAGGYAAAYYSYKWSEVLEADAFTRFRAEGIFNAETGRAFRKAILETGDSVDPNELYERFMGRPPELDALIRRNLGSGAG